MRLPIQFPNSLSGDAATTGMGGRGASPIGIGGSGRSRSGIRLRAENTSLSWSAGGGWGAAPKGCGSTVARTVGERGCRLGPLRRGRSVGRRLRRVDGGGAGRKVNRSRHDIGLTRRHAGLTRLDGIDPGAGVVEARPDRRVNRWRPNGVDIDYWRARQEFDLFLV